MTDDTTHAARVTAALDRVRPVLEQVATETYAVHLASHRVMVPLATWQRLIDALNLLCFGIEAGGDAEVQP